MKIGDLVRVNDDSIYLEHPEYPDNLGSIGLILAVCRKNKYDRADGLTSYKVLIDDVVVNKLYAHWLDPL